MQPVVLIHGQQVPGFDTALPQAKALSRHTMKLSITCDGGLPASYRGWTVASVQARYDKDRPGSFVVISVTYATTGTLIIVFGYCGPDVTFEPFIYHEVEGKLLRFEYLDLGFTPNACPIA